MRRFRHFPTVWSVTIAFLSSTTSSIAKGESDAAEIKARAVAELRSVLAHESQWVKVHAAEALLSLDLADGVAAEFRKEQAKHAGVPEYRIGIWRVLARAATSDDERHQYITKIVSAYLDANGVDRTHAVETLCKLHYQVPDAERPLFDRFRTVPPNIAEPFRLAVLANTGSDADLIHLCSFLDSSEHRLRGLAAYSLRHVGRPLSQSAIDKLAATKIDDLPDLERAQVLAAIMATAKDEKTLLVSKECIVSLIGSQRTETRFEVTSAFALRGTVRDIPLLTKQLADSEADVRGGAANAILQILRRSERGEATP